MKIYYWSPFISYVATTSSVVNSLIAIKKFSKKNIDCKVIDVFNEWNDYKNILQKNNINILNLNKYLNIKYLPKKGFIQLNPPPVQHHDQIVNKRNPKPSALHTVKRRHWQKNTSSKYQPKKKLCAN